ncbi:MAG TPA: tetratricopeptide repeat protein [Steroidobacteraceae bacterium]
MKQQRTGLIAAAIATYRRCLALSPGSPEIHNNLGTALDQAGRLTEAVECFRTALDLDPAYARPLVNLGKALRLQGKAFEAAACLERALAVSPDSPAALTNLGFAFADLAAGRRRSAHFASRSRSSPGWRRRITALAVPSWTPAMRRGRRRASRPRWL